MTHRSAAEYKLRAGMVSLGTALPPTRLSQEQSLQFVLEHFPVRESTKSLYKRVFRNDSVLTRHFAFDHPREVLETDHEKINARFEQWAVRLSVDSLQKAIQAAGLSPKELDFLATTTCTGYLCPGLSAYIVEAAGLRLDIQTVDIVGMGCGAAIPAIRQADNFVRTYPTATAAVVCTEVCSAAMYCGDAVDLVVSNTLFGDGSATAILQATQTLDSNAEGPTRILDYASLTIPEWRDTLRFRTQDGHLRNVLGKEVPRQAGEAMNRLIPSLLERNGLGMNAINHWILHAGGEKVLTAIETSLALPSEKLAPSRAVLRSCGNMSSPTVLFVLDETLQTRKPKPGELGVMASFGAGFSAHAALVSF